MKHGSHIYKRMHHLLQIAIRMFKDEYFLDFINTEELDLSDPQDLDERVLEKEIIDHIRNFIQCLGSGFCSDLPHGRRTARQL